MARITTSKGFLEYRRRLTFKSSRSIDKDMMLQDLKLIAAYLDRTGINWGPAFGSLIGVVRNDDFQPWKPFFDLYILKEDEERFKDVLWQLLDQGFRLVRYERKGLYILERMGEYIRVYVLHKVSSDLRHTGGSDFIHDKYLRNTVKWDFKGIEMNVPAEVDEYLEFQYGADWVTPRQTVSYYVNFCRASALWLQDHLPDSLYYLWLTMHRRRDFRRFSQRCSKAGVAIPEYYQLSRLKPRSYRRVLTVGVYDLLHKGHVELFRRARGLGDYLIVAVQDGEFVTRFKPDAKLMNSTEDRSLMVKSMRYVDEVITYDEVDRIVKDVDFDVFVTGPDQTHDGFRKAIEWCESNGKQHIVLSRTDGISSSELKSRIAAKTRQ